MTTTDVVKQQVQQAALAGSSDQPTVFDLIQRQKPEIDRALPAHLSGDRFARIAMTLVRSTPRLLECDPITFVGALMVSAQLGLEPGAPLGQCWIIPRRNKRNGNRWEANFQWGYKGVAELFRRSGQFLSLQGRAVGENDEFSYSYGLDDELVHKPADEPGRSVRWYAVAKFKDGGHAFVVLSRDQVEKRRKRGGSRPGDGSAWDSDYDSMAIKTCVLALAPWLPLSPELERMLAADSRTFHTITPNLDDLPELEAGDDDEASTPPAALASGGDGASTVETSPSGTIGNGSTEVAAGVGDAAPAPSVEDATGDEAELDGQAVPAPPAVAEPPAWSAKDEDQWSASEWKDFVKTRGQTQSDVIKAAQQLASEFGEKVPAGLSDLKGQTRLSPLVRGWVEEQAGEGS